MRRLSNLQCKIIAILSMNFLAMQKTLISDRKKDIVWPVKHSDSHNNPSAYGKSITKSISFCLKHSNNWKKVTYPYFSASSLASSSFTILWSSRSLLFPHNTMSGFSQYACICSWPNSNNANTGHHLLSHTKLMKNTTTFRRTLSPSGKQLSEKQKTSMFSAVSQDFCYCTEEPENRWTPTTVYPGNQPGEQKPGKIRTDVVHLQLKELCSPSIPVSCQERTYFPLLMDDAVQEHLCLDTQA